MNYAAAEDLSEKFAGYVILKIDENDNSYKQISINEFLEKIWELEFNHKEEDNTIVYASLKIDTDNSEVYRNGLKINLSAKEYKMLLLFMDNKGKILTSEQIINCVWGIAYANAGMLRVAIKRLRNKIDPENEYLKTVRGKGYTLINI